MSARPLREHICDVVALAARLRHEEDAVRRTNARLLEKKGKGRA
jgi:hypothetical protein